MAQDIIIPELGEGVEEGQVVNLLVKQGEEVSEGQGLIELETGKATVDVPSPMAGSILEMLITEGQTCKPGDVIARIETNGAAPAEEAETTAPGEPAEPVTTEVAIEAPAAPAAPAGAPVEMDLLLPELGEGVEEGQVVNLLVAEGDEVREGQGLLELETGKATVDIPAPADGTIISLTAKEGGTYKPGDSIGKMNAQGAAPAEAAPVPAAATPSAEAPKAAAPAPEKAPNLVAAKRADHVPVPAAPSVRKFAREIGVEVREIPGSGPRGRISLDDVKAWSKQLHSQGSGGGARSAGVPAPPMPDFTAFGEIEKEAFSPIRRLTAQHMAACWSTIPHVTHHDHADQTDLEALRKSFKKKAEDAGGKLTVTAMLIKILGSALKVFPQFNASIDTGNEEVIYKKYVNVGCAVDTPKGLVVPVIRDVDAKNMIEIALELGEIAGKVREGKIRPADLTGGCITLTNIGGLHGKHFTPIVNHPEVAILGVGRGTIQPVWDGSAFQPRLLMPLSLSYDHRIIDGADGTRFLRWIVDAVEQPLLISLEG